VDTAELINFLLPKLVVAGDYARKVQPAVKSADSKGGNTFQEALTDADLSIQTFVEVSLLAAYPEIAFYGEEEASSYNTKYFPKNTEYEITLDPVNGTRLFADQYDTFDIIVTLTKQDKIQAAINYVPAKSIFYFATLDGGAFALTKTEVSAGVPWKRFTLPQGNQNVMVFEDQTLLSMLRDKVDAFDLIERYAYAPSSITLSSIFRGELGGWARRDAPLIDLGALAFIAAQAGGMATDFSGNDLPPYRKNSGRRIPEQIVSANKELHQKLLQALS
jgi:myo-inositol-1(or 4)-monophosphatase